MLAVYHMQECEVKRCTQHTLTINALSELCFLKQHHLQLLQVIVPLIDNDQSIR